MSSRTKYILITAVLAAICAGLTYVIFLMDRSPDTLDGSPINIEDLLAKQKPILLEFGKGWCMPCKYMKPILEETARVFQGKAVVATVDMDANIDLVRRFSIRVMPTQIFLSPNGTEFFRNEGVLQQEHIVQIFNKMGLTP